jgi:Uma2 family endonuclease
MAVEITLRPITVREYTKMLQVGILREDDHVELIAGEIRQMSPIGPYHAAIVNRLAELLITLLKQSFSIAIQSPIQLDDMSMPQPDLAVMIRRNDHYAGSAPTANDVLLVIEVSDTTADYDRKEKMPRYASAGIPEMWLIDLSTQTIEKYTHPRPSRYQDIQIRESGDTISSTSVNTIEMTVDRIFGL